MCCDVVANVCGACYVLCVCVVCVVCVYSICMCVYMLCVMSIPKYVCVVIIMWASNRISLDK